MRVKKSEASSRAESFLAARAERTEEMVQLVDMVDGSVDQREIFLFTDRPIHQNESERQRGRSVPFEMTGVAGLRDHRSMTLGTRKKGGSGSGACFRTSEATILLMCMSSRRVASAVWSSERTWVMGATLAVSSSLSLPMYSRISSIWAR